MIVTIGCWKCPSLRVDGVSGGTPRHTGLDAASTTRGPSTPPSSGHPVAYLLLSLDRSGGFLYGLLGNDRQSFPKGTYVKSAEALTASMSVLVCLCDFGPA